jgi:hypothetical protein
MLPVTDKQEPDISLVMIKAIAFAGVLYGTSSIAWSIMWININNVGK